MDDDDDLWGPPFVVQDDTFRKQTLLRGCEFWFDCRTDVLEENFQNEMYCEIVWRILNEKKKQVVVVVEIDDSVSVQNDMASSSGTGDLGGGSSDSDKTLSAVLPDADTSSTKSALDEDENTSSISDAQTIETRDSSTDVEDRGMETRLKPQEETAAIESITVEVAEDAETSSSPVVLGNKIDEAEEHSCSSLVTDQVFDPIKQAPENKSSSAVSRESNEGSALRPLVREKAIASNEDGEDHQQSNNRLQDVVTVFEPFTTESLLEMCDEPDKGKETPEAMKAFVKDELIINLLTEARKKTEKKALLNPGSVLLKKRKSMNTGFIRTTKQKVGSSSVPTQLTDSKDGLSERGGGQTMSDSVMSISDLKNKTGKELKGIAKELKVTHYYKLKKEDLLQQIIMHLKSQQTECTKQIMES